MRQRHLRLCLLLGLLLALLNACSQDKGGDAASDGGGTSTRGNIQLVATFPEPVRLGATAATGTTRATPPTITRLLLQVTEDDPPRILVPGSADFRPCPDIPNDLEGLFCDILPGVRDEEFTFTIPDADVERRFRLEAYEAGRDIPLFVGQTTAVVRGPTPTVITITMQRDIPILRNPGIQTFEEGEQVSFQIESSAPTGATFTFRATNLPPELSINPQSGLISGTLDFTAAAGSPYIVTVATLVNGQVGHSVTFSITVNENIPENLPPEAANDTGTTPSGTPVVVAVLNNDSDRDGTLQPETVEIQRPPGNGTAEVNPEGMITYTPTVRFRGTDTFTYTVADNEGAESNEATVTIAVENAPPQANNDIAGTPPEMSVRIPVLVNDGDVNADPLEVTGIGTPPARGTATVTRERDVVIYTPPPGSPAPETFTYTIRDNQGGTATAEVTVTVDTETPHAVADQAATAVDTQGIIDVLANDLDPNGEELTVTVVTKPLNGMSETNEDGRVTYTPNPGFTGLDTFTYTIEDTTGNSATAVVLVFVGEGGPQAVGNSAITQRDTPIVIPVLANDSSLTGGVVALSRVTDGAHGEAIINNNRTPENPSDDVVVYTPALGFTGLDTFTYTIVDEQGQTALAAVTVRVNAPPMAEDDMTPTLEDTAVTIEVLENDDDRDGTLRLATITVVTPPTHGTVVVNANGTVTYTPAANFFGTDTFTYTVNDNQGASSNPATVMITITAVNDGPSFTRGSNQRVLEDAGPQSVPGWATAIRSGPPNEAGQALTFLVSCENRELFDVPPTIHATGTLTYTPASNANGVATCIVQLQDDDGIANGGVDTSAEQSLTITITPVNDAPRFIPGPNQTMLEDAGPQTVRDWATNITPGAPNETGQTLTFRVSNNNPGLFTTQGQPALDSTGTLTYTPAPNAHGTATVTVVLQDNGGTANGGQDTSSEQRMILTITPVNDAPSFTAGAPQTVGEDAGPQRVPGWATAISPGPPNEATQTVTFLVSNDTPTLFVSQPAISPSGTLTYTPAPNANGRATVTVRLQDDGGTDNGGIDTSPPRTFTLTVTAVNDAPSFTRGPNQRVVEDAGPQTVSAWATNISPGPANEAGQTLTFLVIPDTPALFATPPAINSTGTLTYTPAPNANGTATVMVQLQDNGGTANGGVDTNLARTLTITITPVNDAPRFIPGPNQAVLEDAGPQTILGWATDITPGAPNETGQTLTFRVSNNNPGLFTTQGQPALDSTGTLTYTPAPNAHGTATVTVVLQDDGGTANGGQDTSSEQRVTLTVTSVNDPPSFTTGPALRVPEDARPQTIPGWAMSLSPGPPDEANQTLTFLPVACGNPAFFAVLPSIDPTGTLTFTLAPNTDGETRCIARLQDSGGTANGGSNRSPEQPLIIININRPPDLAPLDDQTLDEGQTRTVSVTATDPGGDSLTFRALNLPSFVSLTIAPNGTGTLAIAPGFGDAGVYNVTIMAADNATPPLTDSESFTITVHDIDITPPTLNEDLNFNGVLDAGEDLDNDGVIDADPAVVNFQTLLPGAPNVLAVYDLAATAENTIPGITIDADPTNNPPLPTRNSTAFVPSATFDITVNESLVPDSINVTNITITDGTTPVSGNQSNTDDATVIGVESLETNNVIRVQVDDIFAIDTGDILTLNVQDEAGNAATITVPLADTLPPFITQVIVSRDTATITLSEPVAPASVTAVTTTYSFDFEGDGFDAREDLTVLGSEAITLDPTGKIITITQQPRTFDRVSDATRCFMNGITDEAENANAIFHDGTTDLDGDGQPDAERFFTLDDTIAPRIAAGTLIFADLPLRVAFSELILGTRGPLPTVTVGGVDCTAAGAVLTDEFRQDPALNLAIGLNAVVHPACNFSRLGVNDTVDFSQTDITDRASNALESDFDVLVFDGEEFIVTDSPPVDTTPLQLERVGFDDNEGNDDDLLTLFFNKRLNAFSLEGVDLTVTAVIGEELRRESCRDRLSFGAPFVPGDDRVTLAVTPNPECRVPCLSSCDLASLMTGDTLSLDDASSLITDIFGNVLSDVADHAVFDLDSSIFVIQAEAPNSAPNFTAGPPQIIVEDAEPQTVSRWATNISSGPPNEATQTVTFFVSNDTPTLFVSQPAISPSGTLSYTPTPNANGVATVTVQLQDNGGTDNGGIDTSPPRTFTLTVTAVNDAPGFTRGPNQRVVEDAGPQTVQGWTTNIRPGPPNEAAQTLTFLVTHDNPALFATPPAIDPTGTLTYTPAQNANGSATVTVRLQDNGETDNGGIDTSPPQTFTLTVTPVNDAPSFTAGPDQTVREDAGPQSLPAWATEIQLGAANEAGQTLTFLVSTDPPVLLTTLPAIDSTGALTYTPAPNTNGTATVTVRLQDNGGTANGGVDTSPPKTFTITVVDARLPRFENIQISHELAGTGTLLTITFTASEPLQANPDVTVAGNPATFSSVADLTFTYTYTVRGTEPEGPAPVVITGTDRAGNLRTVPAGSVTLDLTPPVATLTFPGAALLTYTEVTVRGTAEDVSEVTNIEVNGVPATSTDDFATWEATVLLPLGPQTLTVSTTDVAGNVDAEAVSVTVEVVDALDGVSRGGGIPFRNLAGITVEPVSGRLVVLDLDLNTVLRVNPNTGNRTVISGCTVTTRPCPATNLVGDGVEFVAPSGIAVLEASGQILVVDRALATVLRVNPNTGNRTVVSGCTVTTRPCPTANLVGDGVEFVTPTDIAIAETTDQIVIVDLVLDAVLRVELSTGNRAVVSGCTVRTNPCPVTNLIGDGQPFDGLPEDLDGIGPDKIAVDPLSGQWLVSDRTFDAVFRVNPTTGERAIVSGCTVTTRPCPEDALIGAGPAFAGNFRSLTATAAGQWFVGDPGSILQVDPTTGNRVVVSADDLIGDGDPFLGIADLAGEPSGHLVVADFPHNAVLRVDAINGDRVFISLSDVNRPPQLTDFGDLTVAENTTQAVPVSAFDLDGDEITLTATNLPVFATFSDDGGGNGTLTLAPGFDDAGVFPNVTITATDNGTPPLTDTITFSIVVTNINRVPMAFADTERTDEGVAVAIDVLANDIDADDDTLTVLAVTQGANGTVVINPPSQSTVTYTPNVGFFGSDTFTYTVNDAQGDPSAPATVTVLVNARPVTQDDEVSINEDSPPFPITVLANDTDDNDSLDPATVVIRTAPTNGTAIVNPDNGTVLYTPSPNFFGTDTFTYIVNDDRGTVSNQATVTITVVAVNDQPTFTADNPPTVNEDAGLVMITRWAVFDAGAPNENDQTALYTVTNLSNPSLFTVPPQVAPSGTLTYTPALHVSGSSTFDVQVQDSGGTTNGGSDTSAPQNFTITVEDVRPPIFADILPAPNPARAGTLLTITFTTSEPLQTNPDVTVAGNSATFGSTTDLTFTYTYTVRGSEPVGSVPITITGTDRAGNRGSGAGRVTFDFTAPTFTVLPVAPDPAAAGAVLTLTFTASEALQANPTVTVAGNPANFRSVVGLTFTYIYTVRGSEPEDQAPIDIIGTDLAGNAGNGAGNVTFDFTPPLVTMTFPGSALLTYTEVTVRGTAQDTNGIADINVNDVVAESTDDFANWVATLTLPAGAQDLIVSAEDIAGNIDEAASATILIGALLSFPAGLAVEATDQLVVVDRDLAAVVRVDPVTGDRTIVSDATTGTGPIASFPEEIAVEATDQLVVVDRALAAVVRIDPTTGNRTIVSDATTGTGPIFSFPVGIAVEATDQLVVVDRALAAVVRVDPTTGNRTVLSGCTITTTPCPPANLIGTGPTFSFPIGIAVEATDELVVVDASLAAVVRVDPTTGNRTVLSGCTVTTTGDPCPPANLIGTGSTFNFPEEIAVEATGELVVVDTSLAAVVRVDPTTGNRTVLSGCTVTTTPCPPANLIGTGPTFSFPVFGVGIAVEATGELVVVDAGLDAAVRVDPTTGHRTIVSSNPFFGSGLSFSSPQDIAVEATDQLVVVDTSLAAVVRVDPTTGNRTVLSGCTVTTTPCPPANLIGTGPTFQNPEVIAVETTDQLVVVDSFPDAMVRVDPTTGNRTVLSGCTVAITPCPSANLIGTGPTFNVPAGIAVETTDQLVVVDSFPSAVVRVDPTTGNRAVLSGCTVAITPCPPANLIGTGPAFGFPVGIAVEATGELVVVDAGLDAVVRVDPTTGHRTIVSDDTTGTGPAFGSLVGIAVEATGELIVIDRFPGEDELGDGFPGAVVRVDPITGARTIVSEATTGRGLAFISPGRIAVEATDQLVVVDSSFIVRVDAITGDRAIISIGAAGIDFFGDGE